MTKDDTTVLLCTCNGTLALEGADHRALCRDEIASFRRAVAAGRPVVVGCTRKAALFSALAREAGSPVPHFADLHALAEDARSDASIAALTAAASVDSPPRADLGDEPPVVVIGHDETAIETARRLVRGGRPARTLLVDPADDVIPPADDLAPVFRGRPGGVTENAGSLHLTVHEIAEALPWSQSTILFDEPAAQDTWEVAEVLDLTTGAGDDAVARLLPAAQIPEHSAYLRQDPKLCAHARREMQGCARCLDSCGAGAIGGPERSIAAIGAGFSVTIDPARCVGCGDCAAVCPTGSLTHTWPEPEAMLARLRALLTTWRQRAADAAAPTVLIHDAERGAEMLALAARFGQGLPAGLLPLPVRRTTQMGLEPLLAALAYGAGAVRLLAPPSAYPEFTALAQQVDLANRVAAALGHGDERIALMREDDPLSLADALAAAGAKSVGEAAGFRLAGPRRARTMTVLRHLHAQGNAGGEPVPLQPGDPFGTVTVSDACTLCMGCVNVCPASALGDGKTRPALTFAEENCVQCGLCRKACPERAISLEPRLWLDVRARERRLLREDRPAVCPRCEKAFGSQAALEATLQRLSDLPAFNDPERLRLLRLCGDCRVIVEAEARWPLP